MPSFCMSYLSERCLKNIGMSIKEITSKIIGTSQTILQIWSFLKASVPESNLGRNTPKTDVMKVPVWMPELTKIPYLCSYFIGTVSLIALLMQKLAAPAHTAKRNLPTKIVVEVSITFIKFENMAMPLAASSIL